MTYANAVVACMRAPAKLALYTSYTARYFNPHKYGVKACRVPAVILTAEGLDNLWVYVPKAFNTYTTCYFFRTENFDRDIKRVM